MTNKPSNWRIPFSLQGHLIAMLFPAIMALLMGLLLPVWQRLQNSNPFYLLVAGYGAGFIGIALLLWARLPLYRQRRFWTIGPRGLDRFHRLLYKIAYMFIIVSIALLLIVWFQVR